MDDGPSRRIGRIWSLVTAALAASAPLIGHSAPVSVIGATLRVNNPSGPAAVQVQATFLGDSQSLYTNELYLDSPTFVGPLFDSKVTPVGTTSSLGSFLPETALFIRNQAYFIPNPGSPASYNFGFFTGTGWLPANPDGLPHAIFTFDPDVPDGAVTVSFEDQFGGGDLDFNDAVYSFTNVRAGFVDTALIPDLNPPGNTVVVDEAEERVAAGLDGIFTNEGAIENAGSVFNYGEFANGASLTNTGLFFNDRTALIANESAGLLDNQGEFLSFGSMNNRSEATVSNSGSMVISGTVGNAVDAAFRNEDAANVEFNGASVDNAGEMTNDGLMVLTNTTILNSGRIENRDTISHEGAHILQAPDGVVTNAGNKWVIGYSSSVTGDGKYEQTRAGAVTEVDGTLGGSLIDISEGLLTGSGTIEGQLNVGAGGAVAPGNSPGTLLVDGDLLLEGGRIEIELAALALHDVLEITGEAIFVGGTLEFDFGFTPAAGDSFVFLTAGGGITGAESLSFVVAGGTGGLDFVMDVVGNSMVITAVPLPAGFWLVVTAFLSLVGRVRMAAPDRGRLQSCPSAAVSSGCRTSASPRSSMR